VSAQRAPFQNALFALALAGGLLLRLSALPLPGTGDTTVWKIWMFNAARERVGTLYGVGGSPPERRVLHFAGAEAPVDYPPLALYELGAVGSLYRAWSQRRFPNTDTLNVFVKLAPLAADVGFAALLFVCVRSRGAVVAYWLNPAVIINGSVLGYLDSLYVLPAAGAIVAATSGFPMVAGALIAAAVLTKAQAVFVLPAVALPLVIGRTSEVHLGRIWGASDVLRMILGGAMVGVAVTLPVAAAGGLPNMIQALSRLATHDMVSANACNLWWIVGYLVRAKASIPDLGAWTAFTMPARILGISRMIELGYPNPRIVGLALTAGASAWALWTARRARDLSLLAALAAFLVHAYSTLAAQVHENHLFAAVPLLVLASAGVPDLRGMAVGVSAVVALNLNLFYGFGNGVGYAMPRGLTIVDATVVLAVMNCALLWTHARSLRRACSTADAFRPGPAPGSRRAPADRRDLSATRT
jgi:hypothetical protein